MATDKPRKTDILTPLRDGEFWRINGIAEATEKRLQAAAIHSFRQLASLTPAEIASVLPGQVGVKERASRQDWTGQARTLAERLEHEFPPMEEPAERQHYESFLVELLLDDERSVRRTRISQVRGGQKDGWPGWDPVRLAGWMASQADLCLAAQPAAQTLGEAVENNNNHRPGIGGVLSLSDVALAMPGKERTRRFFTSGQPLELRLSIDLREVVIPLGMEVSYTATVEAARLGTAEQILSGQVQGTSEAQPEFFLHIPLLALEEGTYRLALTVQVFPASTAQPQQEGIHVFQEGGLVHIYSR